MIYCGDGTDNFQEQQGGMRYYTQYCIELLSSSIAQQYSEPMIHPCLPIAFHNVRKVWLCSMCFHWLYYTDIPNGDSKGLSYAFEKIDIFTGEGGSCICLLL